MNETEEITNKQILDAVLSQHGTVKRIETRLDSLEGRIDGLEAKVDLSIEGSIQMFESLVTQIDGVETTLTAKIEGVGTELIDKIELTESRLGSRIEESKADSIKRYARLQAKSLAKP